MIDVADLKEMLGSQGLVILQLQKMNRDLLAAKADADGKLPALAEQLARSEARVAELDAEVAEVGTLRARIEQLEAALGIADDKLGEIAQKLGEAA